MTSVAGSRTRRPVTVPFHTTKYGSELLVDVAAIGEMPSFLLGEPHVLQFYDITLVTRGRGALVLDGTRYPVRPGAVMFTSPGQVRHWEVAGLDGICVFFPDLFLAEFFNDPLFLDRLPYFFAPDGGAGIALSPVEAELLRRRLRAMRRELHPLRRDSEHLLRASLYQVLIKLARTYRGRHSADDRPEPHPVTARYRSLVAEGATRRHDVGFYARELAVSPGYLNSLCLRHLGKNAKEVLARQLVVEARRQLLYSQRSCAEISAALGFRDPSYFSRFFRMRTGRSPTRFRLHPGL